MKTPIFIAGLIAIAVMLLPLDVAALISLAILAAPVFRYIDERTRAHKAEQEAMYYRNRVEPILIFSKGASDTTVTQRAHEAAHNLARYQNPHGVEVHECLYGNPLYTVYTTAPKGGITWTYHSRNDGDGRKIVAARETYDEFVFWCQCHIERRYNEILSDKEKADWHKRHFNQQTAWRDTSI